MQDKKDTEFILVGYLPISKETAIKAFAEMKSIAVHDANKTLEDIWEGPKVLSRQKEFNQQVKQYKETTNCKDVVFYSYMW